MASSPKEFYDRDISWLSFNYRVLQEAKNPEVPLVERLRFLAIYSSNLDEFYRVRVATHRRLMRLESEDLKSISKKAKRLVKKINKRVNKQQDEFGEIFREQLIPSLAKENILLVNDQQLSKSQSTFVRDYFKKQVRPLLSKQNIDLGAKEVFLQDKVLYFAVRVSGKKNGTVEENLVINIPSDKISRFLVIPDEKKHLVIQLDDVVRLSLDLIFPNRKIIHCYSIKLSRDAELHLDDAMGKNTREKIMKSLGNRTTGIPSRFLYDSEMPAEFLKFLYKAFSLEREDLIPGGRYHNFDQFFGFPSPSKPSLEYEPYPHLPCVTLDKADSIFEAISERDHMLHFPYQSYEYVLKFLDSAAEDPSVKSIKITLYRVASDSRVARALIKAGENGKEVLVFAEVKARFDESSNIFWGDRMEAAGCKVIYSFDALKVHTKICVVTRKEGAKLVRYSYLGTGNFNEKTASIYCDHGLFTKDQNLGDEVEKVFGYLSDTKKHPTFEYLLVAPFDMRAKFEALIDNEIANAEAGKKASMVLKMNSLEDRKMIRKIYEASRAGVKVRIIVRGICCLIPGVKGMSKKVKVYSIIDRYLEHGRMYLFHNDGDELIYLASADWMKRNLSRRVEVGFPILDPVLKKEVRTLINYQLKDNTKARKLNQIQNNPYKKSKAKKRVQAQPDTYAYLKEKNTMAKDEPIV
ncbi:MAG: polyphosphate kinase 1 [Flavobacteriales bacterium]|nr:polyphosphate kinase 1 [Flavobacteriales bacterium]